MMCDLITWQTGEGNADMIASIPDLAQVCDILFEIGFEVVLCLEFRI